MSAVALSSARTSLTRYSRSAGLWILLLVAPVAARFMIAGRGAHNSVISVSGQVPWLTSPVLGMELGVVIATLLLPVAFIYLRSNITRRQPWQVEEPSPGSRIAVAYGRWLADLAVLAGVLAGTTLAGIFLALLMMPLGEVDPLWITITVWAIAAPPLAMVASLRILFDARRWTRGALGEVLFFVFWMGSIVMVMAGDHAQGYAAAMTDLDGFMSPLAHGLHGDPNFTIGGGEITAGAPAIHLDVIGGVLNDGYLAARLTWLAIAALVPLIAGLVYLPHVVGKTRKTPAWLKLLQPGAAKPAAPDTRDARPSALPWLNLLAAELRLIASGRLTPLAMLAVAVAGWFLPYAKATGPAAMLLLVFAATAHAGRTEQGGLLALTRTGYLSPWARRLAFVVAGTLLALAMSGAGIGHALMDADTAPLVQALAMGAATSLTAITLGALTRGATTPRLVLLIAWYFYLSWGGGS